MELNEFKYIIIGGLITLGAATGMAISLNVLDKSFRKVKDVQAGYIPTSKLEIKCEDLDKDGKKETIMQVDGINYLFKYDENKNPVLIPYRIEPQRAIVLEEDKSGDKK